MKKFYLIIIGIILIWRNSTFSEGVVGQSYVTTLHFPIGAENTALGESGVSLSNSIYSVFWNPANIPAIYDEYECRFMYSQFYEELLPALEIANLSHEITHEDTTLALFFNDMLPNIDIGYCRNKNVINTGIIIFYDSTSIEIDTFELYETVISNAIAIRALKKVSFGIAFKEYYSRPAPWLGNNGEAYGHTFDVGLKLEWPNPINDKFTLEPSFGFSLLNIGGDSAIYNDSLLDKKPLPKMFLYGGSFKISFIDILSYLLVLEGDYGFVDLCSVYHFGNKLQITPLFSFQIGYMYDDPGSRKEFTWGYTLAFNYRKILNSLTKLYEFLNKEDISLMLLNIKKRTSPLNGLIRPNFHISFSWSNIDGESKSGFIDSPARDGQRRKNFTYGFSLSGSINPKDRDEKNGRLSKN